MRQVISDVASLVGYVLHHAECIIAFYLCSYFVLQYFSAESFFTEEKVLLVSCAVHERCWVVHI